MLLEDNLKIKLVIPRLSYEKHCWLSKRKNKKIREKMLNPIVFKQLALKEGKKQKTRKIKSLNQNRIRESH